jgi:hypothetical protein
MVCAFTLAGMGRIAEAKTELEKLFSFAEFSDSERKNLLGALAFLAMMRNPENEEFPASGASYDKS